MAKKDQAAGQNEPWKGLMTKKNYDTATKGMSAKEKKEFNQSPRNENNRAKACTGG